MSWGCLTCFKPESSDIKQLNYEHYTLQDVPTEVFVFERTLEELHLDSNRIRDLPRPLFCCHGLKILSLSDNEVHSLPPAIASLINLQHLDVSRNALNSIPGNLKGCKHLSYIDISVNPLEKLPEGFTQLISLEELYLNDTYLDFLPANFGRLMRLRILELRENNLNSLPKSIARLIHLQRLDIGQNDFSHVPDVIGNLPNLSELWIDSNHIKFIPPFIGNLKTLIHLDASNNNIQYIPSEIEHCKMLVDLALTCNELRCLPETFGNLRELITFKVDDNKLSGLPNTTGNLSSLEELILSQNELKNLPASIGLLRKLHILNLDDNLLRELPSEIGSCTSLTILSVRSNKLMYVPAEIGHLGNLHVLNLSENLLQNLPVSILNLGQLNALWLSNNQSTPLTTLQQEIDKETGQMVCTNFMFPQSSLQRNHIEKEWLLQDANIEPPSKVKHHISFACDAESRGPGHFTRAPTPHPKELRDMKKYARSIRHMKSKKKTDRHMPVMEEMILQGPHDWLIKKAKVTKPGTDSIQVPVADELVHEENFGLLEKKLEQKVCLDSMSTSEIHNGMTLSSSSEEIPTVSTLDLCPTVHKAECVPKINTQNILSVFSVPTNKNSQNISPNPQLFKHPPPYHIAATYSKHAAHFIGRNVEQMENITNYSDENTTCSPLKRSRDQGVEEPALDAVVNISQDDASSNCGTTNGLNLYEREKEPNGFSENILLPAEVQTGDSATDELSVPFKLHINSFRVCCDSKVTKQQSANHIVANGISLNERLNDIRENRKHSSCVESDPSPLKRCESEIESVVCNTVYQNDSEHSTEVISDLQLQKPHSFTQDKPIASEKVIAPTPHRPRSYSVSVSNQPSPNSDVSSLSTDCILPSASKECLEDLFFITFSDIPKSEERQLEQTSPEHERTSLELLVSPSKVQIPTKFFHSMINTNRHLQSNLVVFSESNLENECSVISISQEVKHNQPFEKVIDNCVEMQHELPVYKLGSEQLNIENRVLVGLHSTNISESENLDVKIVDNVSKQPSSGKDYSFTSIPKDLCSQKQRRSMSKWMFGHHKNAKVFPVTIRKSSELGLSISGRMKTVSNGERYENEIIVTEVHPSGPANSIIMPGDKILEVDGIDFTKLQYDEAINVLERTGHFVCMMISRQGI